MAKHRKTNVSRESKNPLPSPAEVDWLRERIVEWAAEHGRDFPWRHTQDEYRVAVTEILLQQTTATAVANVYPNFFERFPSWEALHAAPREDIREEIAALGLGDRRTTSLKALAAWVSEHDWQLPNTRDELEDVPGIGQYVASAVLAICHGEPEPLLDVNMARVLERFFGIRELADIRDDPWLQAVARMLPRTPEESWSVLDFSAVVCRASGAQCSDCVANAKCASYLAPAR